MAVEGIFIYMLFITIRIPIVVVWIFFCLKHKGIIQIQNNSDINNKFK